MADLTDDGFNGGDRDILRQAAQVFVAVGRRKDLRSRFELTPEDRAYIKASPKVECPACGVPIQGNANFCVNCGIQIPR